jgi:ribonuclease P protein component
VLARAHRLVKAEDYRNTVRRGQRTGTGNTVVYVIERRMIERGDSAVPRFGFIVSKAVGNAVTRNLIRRRLKSVCHSLIGAADAGIDVVVRALPSARDASWLQLRVEVSAALARGTSR